MDCLLGQSSSCGNAQLSYPSAYLFSNLHFSIEFVSLNVTHWRLSIWAIKLLSVHRANNLVCLSNMKYQREMWLWSHFHWFREFSLTYSLSAIKPDSFQPSNDSCGVKSLCVFHVIQLVYNACLALSSSQSSCVLLSRW